MNKLKTKQWKQIEQQNKQKRTNFTNWKQKMKQLEQHNNNKNKLNKLNSGTTKQIGKKQIKQIKQKAKQNTTQQIKTKQTNKQTNKQFKPKMSKQTEKHQIKLNEEINFSTWYIKNTQPTEHTPSSPGSQLLGFGTPISLLMPDYPPREVTYPIPRHFLKMLFLFHPLPNMGYVRSLEGNHLSNQKTLGGHQNWWSWTISQLRTGHRAMLKYPQMSRIRW